MLILIAATAIGLVTGLFIALNFASLVWSEDLVRLAD
jgi:hypothetical protein